MLLFKQIQESFCRLGVTFWTVSHWVFHSVPTFDATGVAIAVDPCPPAKASLVIAPLREGDSGVERPGPASGPRLSFWLWLRRCGIWKEGAAEISVVLFCVRFFA